MRLYRRKQRFTAPAPQASANPYEAMSHQELVDAGKAAGFPPFCGAWPRETLIQKLMETN